MVKCPRCGEQVSTQAVFCGKCGQKLTGQTEPLPQMAAVPETKQPERQGCGLSVAVILTALVVMLAIIGIGIGAVYMGLNDRTSTERQAAGAHYDKGLVYLEQGQLELAVAELELAVQLDPDHRQAASKLQEARQQLSAQPTPTPVLGQETKAAYYQELESAYQQENWSLVVDLADRLLALDPAFQREQVDQMLFDSFYHRGQQAAENGQIGDALLMFDRALVLQPQAEQVLRERERASLYAAALGAWQNNWPVAIDSLTRLYDLDPAYLDVAQRLYDANLAHGDALAQQQAWCKAAEVYQQAMDLRLTSEAVTRHQEMSAKCQEQPGGAEPAPTGQADTGRTAPSGPSGTYVGQLVESTGVGDNKMFVRGHVWDRQEQAVPNVRVQIQAWDWTAVAITDGSGQYAFDGLNNPVTYTLSLLDKPSLPFDVGLERGILAWVDFQEVR